MYGKVYTYKKDPSIEYTVFSITPFRSLGFNLLTLKGDGCTVSFFEHVIDSYMDDVK